ncbi:hypothetical protein GCM10010505_24360 [Kitasatospora aburaviensis]
MAPDDGCAPLPGKGSGARPAVGGGASDSALASACRQISAPKFGSLEALAWQEGDGQRDDRDQGSRDQVGPGSGPGDSNTRGDEPAGTGRPTTAPRLRARHTLTGAEPYGCPVHGVTGAFPVPRC